MAYQYNADGFLMVDSGGYPIEDLSDPFAAWRGLRAISPQNLQRLTAGGWNNLFFYNEQTGAEKYFVPAMSGAAGSGGAGGLAGLGNGKSTILPGTKVILAGAAELYDLASRYQFYETGANGQDLGGYSFDVDPRSYMADTITSDDPFWSGLVSTFFEGPILPVAGFVGAFVAGGALAAGAAATEAAGAAGVAASAAGAAPVFTATAAGGLSIVELGLIATPATASAAIAAGIPAATLAGGVGALTLAGGALIDIAGVPIVELGLVANPATAAAAIEAGIPASMLSGGPGAISLASLFELPPTPPTPPRGTPPGTQAPPAGPLSKAVETAIGAAISTVAGIARQLIGQSLAPDAPAGSQAPPASVFGTLGSNPLVLLLLAGGAVLIATR
jgi:hypothetical protein